jgi:hypothetical protein
VRTDLTVILEVWLHLLRTRPEVRMAPEIGLREINTEAEQVLAGHTPSMIVSTANSALLRCSGMWEWKQR